MKNRGDLSGITVMLTRQCNVSLERLIAEHGGNSRHLPLFSIQSLLDANLLRIIEQKIPQAALVICISKNAAQIILPQLASARTIPWAAVGRATGAMLCNAGIAEVYYPTAPPYDSRELVKVLQKSHIKFKNAYIMVLTGEHGDDWLQDRLGKLGANVAVINVYRRCLPNILPADFAKLFNTPPEIDIILITCTTSLVNLVQLAEAADIKLTNTPLLVISRRIYTFAKARGFTHVYMAKSIAEEDIILALKNYRYVHADS